MIYILKNLLSVIDRIEDKSYDFRVVEQFPQGIKVSFPALLVSPTKQGSLIKIELYEDLESISKKVVSFGLEVSYLEIESVFTFFNYLEKIVKEREMIIGREQKLLAKMGTIVKSLKSEKTKSKEIYSQLREDKKVSFQNINVHHFFKIGMSHGCDYMQELEKGRFVYLNGLVSDDYFDSSLWMEALESYSKHIDSEYDFFSFYGEKIKDQQLISDKNHFYFLKFNKMSMNLTGYCFGGYYILSSHQENIRFAQNFPFDKGFYDQSRLDLRLNRGERLLILSPGVFQGKDEDEQEKLISFCLSELNQKNWKEIPDKIIMQLSSGGEYDILRDDLSMILLEVSARAMVNIN